MLPEWRLQWNKPCTCGSTKKFKSCCATAEQKVQRKAQIEREIEEKKIAKAKKADKKAAKAAKKTAKKTAKKPAKNDGKVAKAKTTNDPVALENVGEPEKTLQDLINEKQIAQDGPLVHRHAASNYAQAGCVAEYFAPVSRNASSSGGSMPHSQMGCAALYTGSSYALAGAEVGLLGHTVLPSQSEVFLNVGAPFCLVTVGLQGSGKSHSTNCVLEACLLQYPHVSHMYEPMAALVCHYDQSDVNCCEAIGLGRPSGALVEFLRMQATSEVSISTEHHPDCDEDGEECKIGRPTLPPPAPYLSGEQILVLCSPTFYKQRKAFYEGVCTVRPLLFKWSQLNAAQIKMLMRLDETSTQLYVSLMLAKLRGYQREGKLPIFEDFMADFKVSCMGGNQIAAVEQRLQLLSSLIYESTENDGIRGEACDIADAMAAGRMVVADLTDPMMSPCEANGVFQVLLAVFRGKHIDGAGKIVAFDEAHRYMGGAGSGNDALAIAITDCARKMRHEGMRLLISTQSPKTLPEELLELTSVLVAHRFQSNDWHAHLSKKVPLPEGSFEQISSLKQGEALIYSASTCVADSAAASSERRIAPKVMIMKSYSRRDAVLNANNFTLASFLCLAIAAFGTIGLVVILLMCSKTEVEKSKERIPTEISTESPGETAIIRKQSSAPPTPPRQNGTQIEIC